MNITIAELCKNLSVSRNWIHTHLSPYCSQTIEGAGNMTWTKPFDADEVIRYLCGIARVSSVYKYVDLVDYSTNIDETVAATLSPVPT